MQSVLTFHYFSDMVRMFANRLGDQCSIPGQVISKTQKMVFYASLLNTQHYKEQIKGKWSKSGKEVAPSATPRCSSYLKGSLRVALDSGRLTDFIYIYTCVCMNYTRMLSTFRYILVSKTIQNSNHLSSYFSKAFWALFEN